MIGNLDCQLDRIKRYFSRDQRGTSGCGVCDDVSEDSLIPLT